MVIGQLVAGLRNKQITKEILEEAASKEVKTNKLVLCNVEQMVQVKEQAKEEAAQLNMEGKMELNKVSERTSKPPGKMRGKTYTNPTSREHPYRTPTMNDDVTMHRREIARI